MRPALVCSLHGVALTLSLGACTPAPFDALLRGGRVLDGTGAPAALLGLADRGRLQPGAVADLVVFDPATVADRATFEAPHQYPAGIPHVFVRGVAVVRNGEVTGARPGVVLRGRGWAAP